MNYKTDDSSDFGDFEFNYAVVIHGTLSKLQQIKEYLGKQQGIIIRYQTLDRGRITIKREDK